jgi:hypothetical protein
MTRYGRGLALLSLVVAPSILHAQRGMGGRRGGMGGNNGGGSRAAPKFPVAKDLEKLNPAALLIDKHKKLSLADSQVASLKALELRIYERNGALLAQYDSVRKEYRPPTGQATTAADDKARNDAAEQMRLMRSILEQLIDRRRTDVQESLALVPEGQKKQAAEFLDKQDKDFLEQIPSSSTIPGGDSRRGRSGNP